MVRINLLPKDKKVKSRQVPEKIFIIFAILIYLFMGASYFLLEKKEKELNKEVEKLQAELAKYKYVDAEIKKLKEKKRNAKEKLRILVKLLEKNLLLIQEVDAITKNIPRGKIFFEELDYKEEKITIKGNSINLKNIAKYIRRLEQYKKFKKVSLEETKRKKIDNQQVINFQITIEKKS